MGIVLPTREQVERWIDSDDGHSVERTLYFISGFNHGLTPSEMPHEWHVPEDAHRSKPALKKLHQRVSRQLPIDDISHAAYIPEEDALITSGKNEYLLPRSVFEEKLRGHILRRSHYILGMTGIVRSNEWRIFDTMGIHSRIDYVRANGEGLAKRGYVILFRDYTESHGMRYPFLVPVFP